MKRTYLIVSFCAIIVFNACTTKKASNTQTPNIVYILADDLGYVDISALNPDSKIKTPNIDHRSNYTSRGMKRDVWEGGFTETKPPDPKPEEPEDQRHNTKNDPQKNRNIFLTEPEKVKELRSFITKFPRILNKVEQGFKQALTKNKDHNKTDFCKLCQLKIHAHETQKS